MPIISLKIAGKTATGDGTKIVCMNDDYDVRLDLENCDTFIQLPVKKLIIKSGTDYQESDIKAIEQDGVTCWQAHLPMFDCQKSVELGVCGKESENADPTYVSKSAVFECTKSVLCGAIVFKGEPKLEKLTATENVIYKASDKNVDGFYEVEVSVTPVPTEQRTVELSMAGGNQLIEPSSAVRAMSQVVVTKPLALIPENIRKGQSIGGVVGTYDKVLTETEIYTDGEYSPPVGVDGFSKVIVNVGNANYAKLLRIGDVFTYTYDTSVNIVTDTPGIVKYENDGSRIIFTVIGTGSCSIILRDFDSEGNVIKTVHYAVLVTVDRDSMLPMEVSDPVSMQGYLNTGEVGTILKYTGNNYSEFGLVHNGLYIIQEVE